MIRIKVEPLTKNRWADFENLFGQKGACGGCWCMWWRLKRVDFINNKGTRNKKLMKNIVDNKIIPGLLAYNKKEPVGWISIAPREDFLLLENSKILKRVDDQKVWSIVCFFIDKKFRGKGISSEILNAVIDYAKKKKAKILEGYPVEPRNKNMPSVFAWTGFASAFKKAGFIEVARRSETRPIMRYFIND
jgi:GNAT superfamily N-acetyltransferase